jgi:molybdopterin/thiamine biosynthesis adenylyltransferase
MADDLRRYDRQMRFEPIGEAGQRAIGKAAVLIVGCGALGTVAAEQLARAGVGSLRVVDRDIIELHNLQRQPLFTERDYRDGLPKAAAAERALRAANSDVRVDGIVEDFNHLTALRLAEGADLILDGTDNFETRLLINDVALEMGVPWVYGGAVAAEGVVKAVIPGVTSCLRCLLESPPPPGESPTCDTVGIIAPTPYLVASLEVALALRILCGKAVGGGLYVIDSWEPSLRLVAVPRLDDCPACVRGERKYLSGEGAGSAAVLCGRDTVQVMPPHAAAIDLQQLAESLSGLGTVIDRRFYLSFDDGRLRLSVFPEGRCLVHGTDDPARAKAAVARYLGG